MTIGERIQMYRKNKGLSQEDLAQKLFVSRQTVSQWETDQTVPTVDNIYRLKEILDISFDELLSDEKVEKEETEEKPLEEYEYVVTREETEFAISKVSGFNTKKIIVGGVVLLIYTICCISMDLAGVFLGILLGAYGLLCILFLNFLKTKKQLLKRFGDNKKVRTQQYNLFSDRLEINVFENGEFLCKTVIKKEDITSFEDEEKYYIFVARNQTYFVDKKIISNDSLLYRFIFKPIESGNVPGKSNVSFWSKILVAVCVISIYPAVLLMSDGEEQAVGFLMERLRMFFWFLPVPVASIVFGIVQSRRGYKVKKNIVVGIIMCVIFCIYGMFPVFFSDVYSTDYEVIVNLEEKTGIDFPDTGEISTTTLSDESENGEKISYSISTVVYDENSAKEFLDNIAKDQRWTEKLRNELIGYLYMGGIMNETYDYCLLYNLDTGEVNTVPAESGKHHFVYLTYDCEENTLQVEDYIIDVVLE